MEYHPTSHQRNKTCDTYKIYAELYGNQKIGRNINGSRKNVEYKEVHEDKMLIYIFWHFQEKVHFSKQYSLFQNMFVHLIKYFNFIKKLHHHKLFFFF